MVSFVKLFMESLWVLLFGYSYFKFSYDVSCANIVMTEGMLEASKPLVLLKDLKLSMKGLQFRVESGNRKPQIVFTVWTSWNEYF